MVAIKQLEKKFGQMPTQLNKCQKGILPRNMVQYPKNDGHCLVVIIRDGKQMIDPSMSIVDDVVRKKISNCTKTQRRDEPANEVVGENLVTQKKLKPLLRPPPPFPQKFKKKNDEGEFQTFISMLKQLYINLYLIDTIE